MTLFEFDDVVVRLDDVVVLDHITTSIEDRGAITCLLGPSGAGKSTLLRLCNRLEIPTSGTVSLRGRDLESIDPLSLRRDVGMVFQRPTLFPGTLRDNFCVAQPDGARAAFTTALERAGLSREFLDRDADSLSGGEAQRACLARTLVTEPRVLLMDEPTSALDPASSHGLEDLGRQLAADGMPILWVTHDLAQASRIADERIVLVDGRLADEHQIAHYLSSEDDGPGHDDGGHDDGQATRGSGQDSTGNRGRKDDRGTG